MSRANLPPVWLVAFAGMAWAVSRLTAPGPVWLIWAGAALVVAGLALAVWAALAFRRARTSIVPRQRPSALVATGPYRHSRNPIYLADLAILAGVALILRAPWALALVPVFQQVLLRLFILPEEAVLEQDLGQPYRDFRARVRRWL